VPTRRHFALLFVLTTPGCALFGDPLLGTWKLEQSDVYDPLTTTEVEGEVTTTTTISGEMVLDTLEGNSILGTYTQTTKVRVVGPEGNDSSRSAEEGEVDASDEGGGEYELDVDGFDDWLCIIEGTELQCEDDDLNDIIFSRVGEEEKP